MTTLGRCPSGLIFRLRPRVQAGRRRLTPPQSPLSDRRSPLVFLRCRDRTFPGTMPPNCQADPGAPPKARPAPCSLDSGQTCDAAYFASYSSPFSLPLRPHSSGRQRRRHLRATRVRVRAPQPMSRISMSRPGGRLAQWIVLPWTAIESVADGPMAQTLRTTGAGSQPCRRPGPYRSLFTFLC